ncbi:unnamed protein product [Rotaria magnacalcarata]|uniref:Uncharacterized protein n=1 Tax=Rotaria magnacalcarata TaxID=392030 RepID=A0A816YQW6_9BILA|nr:unnamed protein product [Rotaria magnacalcarata]CAF3826239.1 unnamed protein product [Rotaria magnacalcarata]
MMKKNRRFPFERSQEKVSLKNLSTTEQPLYPMLRQYTSICRQTNHSEKAESLQRDIIDSNEEKYRLNQLVNYLKQNHDNHVVDTNNFTDLLDQNIQHWKQVKYEWQKYYQEKNRKEQELFDHLIKAYRR